MPCLLGPSTILCSKRGELSLAREQRKLAAILAADVVGYSRLMGRDESGTLARLREHRKDRLEPALARYGGRLVKLTGDGALAEFPSAVDALSAAIEFQQAMVEANQNQTPDMPLVFRMGIHLGDLIVDGDDLYGDGVNVAARLGSQIRRTLNTGAGFVPLGHVLRIGEGVEEGGWDYGKDALCALALVACGFRARYAR